MTGTKEITKRIRAEARDEARRLSEVSSARSLSFISKTWLVTALAIVLPVLVSYHLTGSGWVVSQLLEARNPLATAIVMASVVAAILVVAAQQHALAILMHDGAHFNLARNRSTNELISNWVCAFPVGLVTSLYRRGHLAHHAFTNTNNDPYWVQFVANSDFETPMAFRKLAGVLARDIAGINLLKWIKDTWTWFGWSFLFRRGSRNPLSLGERVQFVAFWSAVFASIVLSGSYAYFFIIWVVPTLTVLPALVRVRSIAEHCLKEVSDELSYTRHVDGSSVERFFIAPLNVNYHIAHHYFPSVPFYNLPALHKLLLSLPEFRERALLYSTYFGRGRSIIAAITQSNSDGAKPT